MKTIFVTILCFCLLLIFGNSVAFSFESVFESGPSQSMSSTANN